MSLSAAQLERLRQRLSSDDWAVLSSLDRLRLATAGQLRRLHWPASSAARTSRRRLAWLAEHRLLTRLKRRVGGVRAGADGFVYLLDQTGRRLLGQSAGRTHEPGRPWLRHRLCITEVYVRCKEAEARSLVTVGEFLTEPDCWRRRGSDLLKPDAYVMLAIGDFEHHAFVEVDLGTEAASTLLKKASTYERHFQAGVEQDQLGLFPQVLWLVDSPRRQAQIIATLARRPAELWKLHRVMRLNQMPEELIN